MSASKPSIIRIIGLASGESNGAEDTFFQAYLPPAESPDGVSKLMVAHERENARVFDNMIQAMDAWMQHPELQYYTMVVEPAERGWNDPVIDELVKNLGLRVPEPPQKRR